MAYELKASSCNPLTKKAYFQNFSCSMIYVHWHCSIDYCVKGCGMGPLLVLVSHCFREIVVVTCKIGSFLCSLDNLLQKMQLFSFLKIKFQNGTHLKKRAIFDLLFTFFSHKGKLQKILQHIFCSPY